MNQYSYDPFDFLDQAEADFGSQQRFDSVRSLAAYYAKTARDEHYRRARSQGCTAHRSTLKNQLEKYNGFGIDGRGYRDVYFLNVTSGNG